MQFPCARTLTVSLTLAAASLPVLQARQAGSIEPPAGAGIVLQAKGDGVQIYTCAASSGTGASGTASSGAEASGGFKWVLTAPDAKLLDASGKAIGRHFAGPTWKLEDAAQGPGQVQGQLMASQPAPESGSVAWLLLRAKPGTATGSLAQVGFIRRTETHGGAAPQAGCEAAKDAGKVVRIPYRADYTFYAAAGGK
jgi:hypothetical protein